MDRLVDLRCLRNIALTSARVLAGVLAVAPAAIAAPKAAPAAAKEAAPAASDESRPEWVFSLLPRAFQKNPRVDFNVITEMTEAGRRAPQPSPESPIYFNLFAGDALDLGATSDGGGKRPNPEYLDAALRNGLAQHGLLPAELPDRPATVLLVCHWGHYSEYALDELVSDTASAIAERRELLDRARLVGGEKFAAEFAAVLDEADVMSVASNPRHPAPGDQPIMGDMPTMVSVWNPIERFMERDRKTRHLVEESLRSVYFVVVSAYDQQMALEKKRLLLWRTKMTVSASGVSMRETLVPLVNNASAFLGKDMPETAVIGKRIDREGRVEFGPLEVPDWEKTTDESEAPQTPASTEPAAGSPQPASRPPAPVPKQ
jgi:hypothetical protein